MKKKFITPMAMILAVTLWVSQSSAGEITYQPVNPNFGGNPFNAAPLLNNASAQNDFSQPAQSRRDSGQDFKERLDRAILSSLSRALTANIVDANGNFVQGTFQSGINTIVVDETGGSTVVTLTNNETGEISVIEIPN